MNEPGNIEGWTHATLYRHITALLREKDKRDEQRFLAQQDAIKAALQAQEAALAQAARSADEALRTVGRAEFSQHYDVLDARLAKVERQTSEQGGRTVLIPWLLAGVATVIAIVALIVDVTTR